MILGRSFQCNTALEAINIDSPNQQPTAAAPQFSAFPSMAESVGLEFRDIGIEGLWMDKSGRSSQSIVLSIISSTGSTYMHCSDTGFWHAKGLPAGVHDW